MVKNKALETIAETKYLRLVRRDGWEYVQRTNATGVVCIAALTDDGKLLLVEQFRPPVNARVIELPAGLAGDEPGGSNEEASAAARRELLEETGYEAAELRQVFEGVTSAGVTDESTTFFVARKLKKITDKLGVGQEAITLHEVPLANLDGWLSKQMQAGTKVDGRVLAGLYLLRREFGLR